jgi:PAS domain S-box-containing protein
VTLDSDTARFSSSLKSAVLWPVGIIFLTATLLLVYIFVLFRVVKWSEHSYQVLAQTRICENLAINTQNDVRGYLLTGDPSFLKSYDDVRLQTDSALMGLKVLVQDNPQQAIRADDLIQAKNTWFEHAKTMISQRAKDIPTNVEWVRMGQNLTDTLNAKFEKFTSVEEALHQNRISSVQRMKRSLAYAGSGFVILLAITVAYVVRKQMMVLASSYRTALTTIEQRHAALARSEQDLEEQKEWLRVTLTSIGDGVVVTDPEGRVVLMNYESERLTGWNLKEALHQPLSAIFSIVNEETRIAVEDPVAKVLKEKKVVGLANHTVLLSRTGEEWPIEDSAAPICNANGNILGVVMVFHDASDMRHAQKTLKAHSIELEKKVADRTVTLQQAVSELEAFSYTVSHDLRSPLRAMQGFSVAVLEDYGDKLNDQGKNYLERIKNAAERLDRLIQDLLSYTRISRQNVPLESIDLDRVLHDIVEHYPHLNAPAAKVDVTGTFSKVMGREALLTQVFSNLLGNAVKFVPEGTMPHIRVWSEDRGSRLRVWVQDNGIGISSQDQERIFQMFVQVHDFQLYGGTGVGLAIVKKAVETMRGTVGVESDESIGSKFWVELNKASS